MKLIKAALLLSSFTCLESFAMEGKGGPGQFLGHMYRLGQNLGLDNPLLSEAQQNRQQRMFEASRMENVQRSQQLQDQLTHSDLAPSTPRESIVSTQELLDEWAVQQSGNFSTPPLSAEDQTGRAIERANRFLIGIDNALQIGDHNTHVSQVPPLSSTVEATPAQVLSVANYERLMENPNDDALLRQITRDSYQAMLDLLRVMTAQEAWENQLLHQPNNDAYNGLIWTLEKSLANWDQTYHPNALRALYYATRSFEPCAEYQNTFGRKKSFMQCDLEEILAHHLFIGGEPTPEAFEFYNQNFTINEEKLREKFPQEFTYSDREGSKDLYGFGQAEWTRYERNNRALGVGLESDKTYYGPAKSCLYKQLRVLPVFLPQGITATMVLNAAKQGYRLVNLGVPDSCETAYQRSTLRETVTAQDLIKYQRIAEGIKKMPKAKRPALYESLRLLMASQIDPESEDLPRVFFNESLMSEDRRATHDWAVSKRYWSTYWSLANRVFPNWKDLPNGHWELFSIWANPNRSRL